MSGVARVAAMIFVAFDSYFRYDNAGTGTDDSSGSGHGPPLVTGLLLARAGSKGIPHKNLANLNGHPLIHWSLEAMLESGVFHTIWVSTDDPEIKAYVLKKNGVLVHDRAAYTATDDATSISAAQEFLTSHPEIESNIICLVQATSPFIQPKYLTEGFNLMISHSYDSVFSVTRQYKLRWSELTERNRNFGGFTKSLNFNSYSRPRRQDWSGEIVENGMFYFSQKELLMRGAFQGERSTYVEIPKEHSLEIDTPEDLIFANILMSKYTEESKNNNENDNEISRVKYFIENEVYREEL